MANKITDMFSNGEGSTGFEKLVKSISNWYSKYGNGEGESQQSGQGISALQNALLNQRSGNEQAPKDSLGVNVGAGGQYTWGGSSGKNDKEDQDEQQMFPERKTNKSARDRNYTYAAEQALQNNYIADPNALAMPTLSDLDYLTPDERDQWQVDTALNLADSLLTGIDLITFGATAAPHMAGRAAVRGALLGGRKAASVADKAADAMKAGEKYAKVINDPVEALGESGAKELGKLWDEAGEKAMDTATKEADKAAKALEDARPDYRNLINQNGKPASKEKLQNLINTTAEQRKATSKEAIEEARKNTYNETFDRALEENLGKYHEMTGRPAYEDAVRGLQSRLDEAADDFVERGLYRKPDRAVRDYSDTALRDMSEDEVRALMREPDAIPKSNRQKGRLNDPEQKKKIAGANDAGYETQSKMVDTLKEDLTATGKRLDETRGKLVDESGKVMSPEELGEWVAKNKEEGGLLTAGRNLSDQIDRTYGSAGKRIATHIPIWTAEAAIPTAAITASAGDNHNSFGGVFHQKTNKDFGNRTISPMEQARINALSQNPELLNNSEYVNSLGLTPNEKIALNVPNQKRRNKYSATQTGVSAEQDWANAMSSGLDGWDEISTKLDLDKSDPMYALAQFTNRASDDDWYWAIHNVPGWADKYSHFFDIDNKEEMVNWLNANATDLAEVQNAQMKFSELTPEQKKRLEWMFDDPNFATRGIGSLMAENQLGPAVVDMDMLKNNQEADSYFDRGMGIYNMIPLTIEMANGEMPMTLDELNAILALTPEKLEFGVGTGYDTNKRQNALPIEEMLTGNENRGLYGTTNLPDQVWKASGKTVGSRGTGRKYDKNLRLLTEDNAKEIFSEFGYL